MLNKRYLYNTKAHADKLHETYRGVWGEQISHQVKEGGNFYSTFQQILRLIPDNIDESSVRRALTKWVRVFDPNMIHCSFNADDSLLREMSYSDIQNKVMLSMNKDLLQAVHSLTFAGRMTATIEYAKQNKDIDNPNYEYSAYIQKFADPMSEWYHDKFAKDFCSVCHPNWKRKTLSGLEEKQELLDLWFKANAKENRFPTTRDNWLIPKGHRLEFYAKQGYKILPTPGAVWKELGKVEKAITMLMGDINKGIRPKNYDNFKYHYPKEAEKLEKKYPNILAYSQWLKNNLTPTQQEKVDKWNRVAELLLVDEPDDVKLMLSFDGKTRNFLGNHLKMLDKDMSMDSDKVKNIVFPIIEKIKKARPTLYKMYTEKEDGIHGRWGNIEYDIKNKETQKEILKLAKSGAEWPTGNRAITSAIGKFCGKNTKYPEFNKELRALRPDWFNMKIRNNLIRKRFYKDKKAKKDGTNG